MELYTKNVVDSIMSSLNNKVTVSNTAYGYLLFLIQPYVDILKDANSIESLNDWVNQVFDGYLLQFIRTNLNGVNTVDELRYSIITTILSTVLDATNRVIGNMHFYITPWDVKFGLEQSYIPDEEELDEDELDIKKEEKNLYLGKYFGLKDGSYMTRPDILPVTVTINMNSFTHDISYDHVIGIMAFYQFINRPISLTMFGYSADEYYPNIDAMKSINQHFYSGYTISLISQDRQTIFFFDNSDFARGLLTAAEWLDVDPHFYIKDLTRWQQSRVVDGFPVEGNLTRDVPSSKTSLTF